MTDLPRCCIVGAGCSGFTTAKALKDRGIPFDCFEMSDVIGGNWAYRNRNGMSACYESLHIDTSKHRMAFEEFPIPPDFPDFPHHSQIFNYFNDYVDHFGLRGDITFNTAVTFATRRADGIWEVTIDRSAAGGPSAQTRLYDALFVCNGHHWDPRWPEFEGMQGFTGIQMHAHSYPTPFEPHDMRGKRIVVVGMGNSAMDIASELSQRPIAEKLFVAARRGVWVLPKYINGQVADKGAMPAWIPLKVQRAIARRFIRKVVGNMEDYGLPKPDHEPLEAHPSVSGEFLTRVGCGDITAKPNIRRFDGNVVEFEDGSREEIDAVIYATGYNVSFPFLDEAVVRVENNHVPLFKRIFRPDIPNLFFMALGQPLPTLVNFAERQMKLVGDYLTGAYALPDEVEMERVIGADEDMYTGHFYKSARHTMQLDFNKYVWDMHREIRRGARRAAARGHTLPVPARAAARPAAAAEQGRFDEAAAPV